MAINTWVNVTADKAAASKQDRADHVHKCVPGTADANDFTVAWDNAVITNLTTYDSAAEQARRLAISRGLR